MDLPEGEVVGVLYETYRKKLSRARRVRRFLSLIPDPDFRAYALDKVSAQLQDRAVNILDRLLSLIHASPEHPNGPPVSLDDVVRECASRGIDFHITNNIHDPESLSFVRNARPDLGVIYGTRILKPELFTIPDRGSINIHKHKVPEYRGGGAPGLWELRDGQAEMSVTVHRVVSDVDAGAILGERTFPIEKFDTLHSVGLKADLLGVDLLIDVLRAESRGCSTDKPQPSGGKVYKGFAPHQVFAIERSIRAGRAAYKPTRGRPRLKLALRTLTYPALFFRNRRRRRQKKFPVLILYHHLITDKPKFMGLPTEQFAKQVRYLKKHYRIASLPEALDALRKGEVEVPTVVLTFDDGYAENFLGLRAVAEAENIPVTIFVCTQKVSETSEFQHDLDINESGFPALNWEQVRYFDRHCITIGSHTRNHLDCGTTDQEMLADEIVGSLEDLRRELDHDVEIFAFPKGHRQHMSEPAVRLAKETYPYIFSAYGGVNYGPIMPPCELYRCSHTESLWELELLLQSVLEFGGKHP